MSRKTNPSYNPESRDPDSTTDGSEERNDHRTSSSDEKVSNTGTNKEPGKQFGEVQGYGRMYDYAANLPMEFYHYYYGSNTDMGTLIEVIAVIISALFTYCRILWHSLVKFMLLVHILNLCSNLSLGVSVSHLTVSSVAFSEERYIFISFPEKKLQNNIGSRIWET